MRTDLFCIVGGFFSTWPREKLVFTLLFMPFYLCLMMCLRAYLYPVLLQTSLLTGNLYKSEVHYPLLAGSSCTFGLIGNDASVFLKFSPIVNTIGSWLGVSLGSLLRSIIKHILPHKIFIMYFVLADYCYLYPKKSPYPCGPTCCIYMKL